MNEPTLQRYNSKLYSTTLLALETGEKVTFDFNMLDQLDLVAIKLALETHINRELP